MSKTKKYHHGNIREVVLELVRNLLRDGKTQSLSVRNISNELGVSRTATYHHFKNMHDLITAACHEEIEAYSLRLELHLNQNTAFDQVMKVAASNAVELRYFFKFLFGVSDVDVIRATTKSLTRQWGRLMGLESEKQSFASVMAFHLSVAINPDNVDFYIDQHTILKRAVSQSI